MAAAVLTALVVAGCGQPTAPASIRADEVVGTWVSPDGGLFRFAADGTVTASDLLGEALMSKYEGRRLSGSGRWHLGPAPLDGDGRPDTVRLQLDVSETGRRWGGGLYADVNRLDPVLFFFISDPDSGVRYEFTRSGSGTAASSGPSAGWHPTATDGPVS